MKRTTSRAAWALVAIAAAIGCTPAAQGPRSAPPSPPGKAAPLVVSIVVDQLGAWVADERWPTLPADGGFARLLREGTYARDVRYAHAVTDTAPGHSALYTGATPRASGVWGNEVLDGAGDKISVLTDDATHLVTASGVTGKVGSSARVLTVDTVADRFRAARPDAVILSMSLKDRGAIFAGGRAPTASLWLDKKQWAFVTSTAFATALPPWVLPIDHAKYARTWEPLDAPWVASHARLPDAQPGEGDLDGLGVTFPHPAVTNGSAFRATPFADEALLDLAVAALDATRGSGRPTLLAVSLSANDYVGHTFGPDSHEAWDELRRLDATLARFFAALDARAGADGWSVILSADHGVTTMPEAAGYEARPWCARKGGSDRWQRACGPVGRLLPKEITAELRAAARTSNPAVREAIAGVIDPYVYLTSEARALTGPDAARLRDALTKALLAHPEIDRVIDTRTLAASAGLAALAAPGAPPCPPEADDSVDALVCRSFVPGRSGDLYVVTRRGSFFDPDVVIGKGTSHGSPYLFDRSVPVVVRAPGRAAAGRIVEAPQSFRVFARSLATLLGVDPGDPEAARATDLVTRSW